MFKGEKDLTVKETILDGDIKIKPSLERGSTTIFWLYVNPPQEEQIPSDNRIIFMRGEMTSPSVAFYIN